MEWKLKRSVQAEDVLNFKSGWKALTGTADFKEITEKADTRPLSDPMCHTADPNTLAFRIMLDRILHFAGAYHLALHGDVDALVFAGGVGERSVELRRAVGESVGCLGFAGIDERKNSQVNDEEGVIVDIGRGDGRKRMLVCHTDEQLEMARECSWNLQLGLNVLPIPSLHDHGSICIGGSSLSKPRLPQSSSRTN